MGGVGSGPRKQVRGQMKDAIDNVDVDRLFKKLEAWAEGKEVVCPHCGERTGAYTADTVALQSILELLNRRLGKSVQKSISLTGNIQLSGDDCDELIGRFKLVQRALLPGGDIIEGEVRKEGITE